VVAAFVGAFTDRSDATGDAVGFGVA
jgi:hypothetical protein